MEIIKYNLGCGTDIKEGFINIDKANIKNVKGRYEKGDIMTYQYEKTDLFLLDNIFEHFSFINGKVLLLRLKKYLKPNGKIIIIVPDFQHLSKVINLLSPDILFASNAWCSNCLLGTQLNPEDYHKSFYTQLILNYVCEVAGYNIEQMGLVPYERHGGYHIKAVLSVKQPFLKAVKEDD